MVGIGWIELMIIGGVGIVMLLAVVAGVLFLVLGGTKNEPRNE
jgi:hypothetical protein